MSVVANILNFKNNIDGLRYNILKLSKNFTTNKNKNNNNNKYFILILNDIKYSHNQQYIDTFIKCNLYKKNTDDKDDEDNEDDVYNNDNNEHLNNILKNECTPLNIAINPILYINSEYIIHNKHLSIFNKSIIYINSDDLYNSLYERFNNIVRNNYVNKFEIYKELLYITDCVLLYYNYLNDNNKTTIEKYIIFKHAISRKLIELKSIQYNTNINLQQINHINDINDINIKKIITREVIQNEPNLLNIIKITMIHNNIINNSQVGGASLGSDKWQVKHPDKFIHILKYEINKYNDINDSKNNEYSNILKQFINKLENHIKLDINKKKKQITELTENNIKLQSEIDIHNKILTQRHINSSDRLNPDSEIDDISNFNIGDSEKQIIINNSHIENNNIPLLYINSSIIFDMINQITTNKEYRQDILNLINLLKIPKTIIDYINNTDLTERISIQHDTYIDKLIVSINLYNKDIILEQFDSNGQQHINDKLKQIEYEANIPKIEQHLVKSSILSKYIKQQKQYNKKSTILSTFITDKSFYNKFYLYNNTTSLDFKKANENSSNMYTNLLESLEYVSKTRRSEILKEIKLIENNPAIINKIIELAIKSAQVIIKDTYKTRSLIISRILEALTYDPTQYHDFVNNLSLIDKGIYDRLTGIEDTQVQELLDEDGASGESIVVNTEELKQIAKQQERDKINENKQQIEADTVAAKTIADQAAKDAEAAKAIQEAARVVAEQEAAKAIADADQAEKDAEAVKAIQEAEPRKEVSADIVALGNKMYELLKKLDKIQDNLEKFEDNLDTNKKVEFDKLFEKEHPPIIDSLSRLYGSLEEIRQFIETIDSQILDNIMDLITKYTIELSNIEKELDDIDTKMNNIYKIIINLEKSANGKDSPNGDDRITYILTARDKIKIQQDKLSGIKSHIEHGKTANSISAEQYNNFMIEIESIITKFKEYNDRLNNSNLSDSDIMGIIVDIHQTEQIILELNDKFNKIVNEATLEQDRINNENKAKLELDKINTENKAKEEYIHKALDLCDKSISEYNIKIKTKQDKINNIVDIIFPDLIQKYKGDKDSNDIYGNLGQIHMYQNELAILHNDLDKFKTQEQNSINMEHRLLATLPESTFKTDWNNKIAKQGDIQLEQEQIIAKIDIKIDNINREIDNIQHIEEDDKPPIDIKDIGVNLNPLSDNTDINIPITLEPINGIISELESIILLPLTLENISKSKKKKSELDGLQKKLDMAFERCNDLDIEEAIKQKCISEAEKTNIYNKITDLYDKITSWYNRDNTEPNSHISPISSELPEMQDISLEELEEESDLCKIIKMMNILINELKGLIQNPLTPQLINEIKGKQSDLNKLYDESNIKINEDIDIKTCMNSDIYISDITNTIEIYDIIIDLNTTINKLFKEAEEAAKIAEQEAARIEADRIELEEAKKIAEQEAIRIAAEQEAIRIAAEQEAIRIAAEQEALRISAEQQAARIAAEQEALRISAKLIDDNNKLNEINDLIYNKIIEIKSIYNNILPLINIYTDPNNMKDIDKNNNILESEINKFMTQKQIWDEIIIQQKSINEQLGNNYKANLDLDNNITDINNLFNNIQDLKIVADQQINENKKSKKIQGISFEVDNIIISLKQYTQNEQTINNIYDELNEYIFDKDIQIISDYIIYNYFKKKLYNNDSYKINEINNYYFQNIEISNKYD